MTSLDAYESAKRMALRIAFGGRSAVADEAGAVDPEQRRAAVLGVVDLALDVAKGALGQDQPGPVER